MPSARHCLMLNIDEVVELHGGCSDGVVGQSLGERGRVATLREAGWGALTLRNRS